MRRPKREADRVATARAKRDRQIVSDEASHTQQDKRDRIDKLVEEAGSLMPAALKALAGKDYEGIRELKLRRKRVPLLGDLLGYKIDRVGAYVIYTYDHPQSYGHPAGS